MRQGVASLRPLLCPVALEAHGESPEYLWRAMAIAQIPATVRGLSIEPLLAPFPTDDSWLAGID